MTEPDRLRTPTSTALAVAQGLLVVGVPLNLALVTLDGGARVGALVLVLLVAVAFLRRASRIGAEFTDDSVTSRGLLRTLTWSWADVQRVRWKWRGQSGAGVPGPKAAQVVLTSGHTVTLAGTECLYPREADRVLAALRRHGSRAGVPVEPAYDETPPPRH